jgi:hypothetical protein
MKEVAFGALALAIVGAIAMIISAYYAAVHSNTDCTDADYLNEEYPSTTQPYNERIEWCIDDTAAQLRLSIFLYDIGYPILLLGLVLMIGANRFTEPKDEPDEKTKDKPDEEA